MCLSWPHRRCMICPKLASRGGTVMFASLSNIRAWIRSIGLLLALVCFASPVAGQVTWEAVSGTPATDIAIADDGTVWLVSTQKVTGGYAISKAGPTQARVSWESVAGAATRIAVEGRMPWIINESGSIHRWNGSKWQRVDGPQAVDIGASAKGVWIMSEPQSGANYVVSRWTGEKACPPGGQATPEQCWSRGAAGGGVRIDVDSAGNPWVIDAVGR